jgi:peptidoglycan/xylan/chitin deacetylase (PgdA/CDA1 family)
MTSAPRHAGKWRGGGLAVISLDFELRWGVHDVYGFDFDAYRGNLERVREVVPALLRLFQDYDISATWAAVGALGCDNWDEYFRRAPAAPEYRSSRFKVKRQYADLDPSGRLHFAPELLRQIVAARGQEVGTHTFSHLYLREDGIKADDVAADLAAASTLLKERFGVEPVSLVFPRNQPAFLEVIRSAGIKIWRGNPGPWYYECEDSRRTGPIPRILKLLDAISPFRRHVFPLQGDMTRASLFLRVGLPNRLWAAHLRTIKRELVTLERGEIFHLWFHPHNLGEDTTVRLGRVEQVLEIIAEGQRHGKLRSCSMGDLLTS